MAILPWGSMFDTCPKLTWRIASTYRQPCRSPLPILHAALLAIRRFPLGIALVSHLARLYGVEEQAGGAQHGGLKPLLNSPAYDDARGGRVPRR